ncbi:O-antigen ligase family protein [Rhabdaerophilum sp. SD176]|uniref:O-antigen ligase family protein n=1 Tax=Rhabdaerophilum sp. SD176 TaxID=2983548 RepID=UPI0024E03071|nr:O-antigen ligase family protein [Rhabdaerophilum sp. SD176]
MRPVSHRIPVEGRQDSSAFALAICLLVFVIGTASGFPLGVALVATAIGLAPFAIRFCMGHPFLLCLGFVAFSFFRLHEVFPVLLPLRIPQLLAIPTLGVIAWHALGSKALKPFLSRELVWFGAFFLLVTIGVPFATDRPTAIAYWTATYVKIGIMTLAIAWLVRKPGDFLLFMRVMVLAGVAVAAVALQNKAQGIGLVEGTRVTIGRDIGSVLGDPNDLSLVLLFPLSFAVGMTVSPTGRLDRTIGLLGSAAIIAAIIATQSRGGLLGMVAVFGTVGWRLVKNKMLLVTIGLIGLAILFAAAGISSRASGGAHEEGIDESAMGRIYAWEAAIKMATQRPLTGVGLDNFVPNYFFYSDHWDGMNHAVHSTWFGVLGETGLPGLIVFVTMIAVTARSLLRTLPRIAPGPETAPVRAAGLGLLSGVAGFCLSGTFLTQGFTWPVYVLVALSAALSRSANPVRDLQIRILATPIKNHSKSDT